MAEETIEQLEKRVDGYKSWSAQTQQLRESQVSVGGFVGTLAEHAARMGLVYHTDVEGQFVGLAASWLESARNGYTAEEMVRVCSAVRRIVGGAER